MPGDDTTWIETVSGKQFWPLNPRVEDIDIDDIATSLAMTVRFRGMLREFYSVAEHSVRAAVEIGKLGRRRLTLTALLHDASEAYLTDLPTPIKLAMPDFIAAEAALDKAIAARFNIEYPFPPEIHEIDNIMVVTERRDLKTASHRVWSTVRPSQPLSRRIVPWDWRSARERFLQMFDELVV